MPEAVLVEAAALASRRQPFALATVVWRRAPSSSHVGDKALILPDGTVRGWISGACAHGAVVSEAQRALADGTPRLLHLGPGVASAGDEAQPAVGEADQGELGRVVAGDGRVVLPMGCESEGAIEVYVEPVLPRPHVVVIGHSPAVSMLASLAEVLGWDVAVVDEGGAVSDHPHPELVHTALELDDLGIGPGSAVVVATQGHYDDQSLAAALATDAGYVGLVASTKRAAGTIERLRSQGWDETQLSRVVSPAGLDLGPVEHEEIGVAILADLVARRASGALRPLPDDVDAVLSGGPCCH